MTPSDALFGVWVHTSAFAISLVVLGFAANWGFPIVAGVLAGRSVLLRGPSGHLADDPHRGRGRSMRCSRARCSPRGRSRSASGSCSPCRALLAGLIVVGAQPMVDLGGT